VSDRLNTGVRKQMRTIRFTAFICIVLFAIAAQAHGQAAPGVFADANHPSGAPDPQKLDDIWRVDAITGQVSINIPFDTTPEGGRGPKIPFRLIYNSGSTITLQESGNVILPGLGTTISNTAQLQWGPPNPPGGSYASPAGPWTTSGPYLNFTDSQMPNNTNPLTGTILQYGCTVYGPYLYTDEDGVSHDMNLEFSPDASQNSNQIPPCVSAANATATYGNGYYTTDGSAMLTVSTTGGTLGNQGPLVTYPDGTQYYLSGAYSGLLEDPNGNTTTITINSGGTTSVTDSLSRTAFSTTVPVDKSGTIPVGTYQVTTSGESGSNEQYGITFSRVSIGTFSMPHPTNSEVVTNSYCYASGCPTGYNVSVAPAGTQFSALQSISRPDGTTYTFHYDNPYGTISEIDFPTGGSVKFAWTVRASGSAPYGSPLFDAVSDIVVTDVWLSDGSANEDHWTYNLAQYSANAAPSSTVTAPDGTETKYTGQCLVYSVVSLYFSGSKANCKEASRSIYNGNSQLIKTVAQNFYANGLPYQFATTLYDGSQPIQQLIQYDRDTWGNVTIERESDYYTCGTSCPDPTKGTITPGSGWLRQTYTSFAYTTNSTLANKHIVNKPSQVAVEDGSGNPYAVTNYAYDNNGNLQTESKCLSPSGTGATATCPTTAPIWQTHYTYDSYGQVQSKTDAYSTSAVPTE